MEVLFTSDREAPHVGSSSLGSGGENQILIPIQRGSGCDTVSKMINQGINDQITRVEANILIEQDI